MPSTKHTVRGHEVRTSSQRRYVVWAGREQAIEVWSYVAQGYVPAGPIAPEIVARSDSFATAQKRAAKARPRGGYATIVDTVTGEQYEG